jgi:hypothetical protein
LSAVTNLDPGENQEFSQGDSIEWTLGGSLENAANRYVALVNSDELNPEKPVAG